mmetsp:Transcript_1583/g.4332  ORF Transcript_1583/g.4332 Transcript_1583/m.4332 type:complete len:240 (-) Transcript_1583:344-1063(-)
MTTSTTPNPSPRNQGHSNLAPSASPSLTVSTAAEDEPAAGVSGANHNHNHNNSAGTTTSTPNAASTPTTVTVTPRAGRLVLFEHDLYHSSAPLAWGTKFVLRTDILLEDSHNDDDDKKGKRGDNDSNCKSPKQSKDIQKSLDNPKNDASTSEAPCVSIVHDLCEALQWSPEHRRVLQDMGLLHDSIQAFLVPPRAQLSQMLAEEGIPRPQIQVFLDLAAHEQQQQQQPQPQQQHRGNPK